MVPRACRGVRAHAHPRQRASPCRGTSVERASDGSTRLTIHRISSARECSDGSMMRVLRTRDQSTAAPTMAPTRKVLTSTSIPRHRAGGFDEAPYLGDSVSPGLAKAGDPIHEAGMSLSASRYRRSVALSAFRTSPEATDESPEAVERPGKPGRIAGWRGPLTWVGTPLCESLSGLCLMRRRRRLPLPCKRGARRG